MQVRSQQLPQWDSVAATVTSEVQLVEALEAGREVERFMCVSHTHI